ncbi:MAG: DUF72 domain-containing protein [Desulfobacteraceae bacterium]|nr:MAG: DUF72 domain-containing protein [Desulfobacteraceae bacterium]
MIWLLTDIMIDMKPTLPDKLNIGTCSWKYDSWKGILYPHDCSNYLEEYARHFSIVEIDQWFWSLFGEKIALPKPETVLEYLESVPGDFTFSIKVPNAVTLTHQYRKPKSPLIENPHFLSSSLFESFLKSIDPMARQIDSLIFQFEYLNKEKMPGQYHFQDQLHHFFENCPQEFRYCIEIRNKNYLNRPWFEFLKNSGLFHVFLQGYWMPPVFEIYGRFQDFIENFSLIRLHGPDRGGIEKQTRKKWNSIVAPHDGELQKLKIMIQKMLSKGMSVTLNVNNHYEGSAPLTIERFTKLWTAY